MSLAQWQQKLAAEQSQIFQLGQKEEEAQAEEKALHARLAEVNVMHRQLDNMMFGVQSGWADLYKQLDEFPQMPPNDRTMEIAEIEGRVEAVRLSHSDAQQRLELARSQLASLQPVVEKKRAQSQQLDSVVNRFEELEKKRADLMRRARRVQDLETAREREVSKMLTVFDYEIEKERQEEQQARQEECNSGGQSFVLDMGGNKSEIFVNSIVMAANGEDDDDDEDFVDVAKLNNNVKQAQQLTSMMGNEQSVVFSLTGMKKHRTENARGLTAVA